MLKPRSNVAKFSAALALLLTASSVVAMPVLTPVATNNGFNGTASPAIPTGVVAKSTSGSQFSISMPDYGATYNGLGDQAGMNDGGSGSGSNAISEPTVLALMGVGLIGLALGRRRRA